MYSMLGMPGVELLRNTSHMLCYLTQLACANSQFSTVMVKQVQSPFHYGMGEGGIPLWNGRRQTHPETLIMLTNSLTQQRAFYFVLILKQTVQYWNELSFTCGRQK